MGREGEKDFGETPGYSKIMTIFIILILFISVFFYLFVLDSPTIGTKDNAVYDPDQNEREINELIVQTERDINTLKQDIGE